ncbi:MAG: DUF5666 domain-containing protein [Actinomycetota bacterium]
MDQQTPAAWNSEDAGASHEPDVIEEDTSAYVDPSVPLVAPARFKRRFNFIQTGLVMLLIASLGFYGGVRLEKAQAANSAAASLRSAFQRRFGGAGAGGLSSLFGGGGGGAVSGTVKLVDGKTIYITDPSGNITQVTTTSASSYSKTSKATLKDIKPGDSVSVDGQTGSDGTVTATRVTDNGASGGN